MSRWCASSSMSAEQFSPASTTRRRFSSTSEPYSYRKRPLSVSHTLASLAASNREEAHRRVLQRAGATVVERELGVEDVEVDHPRAQLVLRVHLEEEQRAVGQRGLHRRKAQVRGREPIGVAPREPERAVEARERRGLRRRVGRLVVLEHEGRVH